MAKNRMAGEKLDEPTQESADAKEALSRSEQNKRTREEIGNDPERLAERIGGVDREKYDFDGYTDKQINMALQGKTFGDEDYARLTGESLDKPDDDNDVNIPTPVPGPDPTPTPEPKPETPGYTPPKFGDQIIGYPGFVSGAQTQNVNQDNDITSNVTGDNNTVTNNQDNSVRQYGAYGTADRAKMLRDRYVADVSRFTGVS